MDEKQLFEKYLAGKNLRVTRERIAILDEVMRSAGHLDVDTLQERIRSRKLPVSRATLYRTLTHLVDSGLVQKILTGEGQARYEKMYGRVHHDHMICVGCGEIIEFENEEIERLQDWVCKKKRFTIVTHTLQIKGFCESCSTKRRSLSRKERS